MINLRPNNPTSSVDPLNLVYGDKSNKNHNRNKKNSYNDKDKYLHLAIYAVIIGVIGLVTSLIPIVGYLFSPFWIISIILGVITLRYHKVLSTVSIILGTIPIVLNLIILKYLWELLKNIF